MTRLYHYFEVLDKMLTFATRLKHLSTLGCSLGSFSKSTGGFKERVGGGGGGGGVQGAHAPPPYFGRNLDSFNVKVVPPDGVRKMLTIHFSNYGIRPELT